MGASDSDELFFSKSKQVNKNRVAMTRKEKDKQCKLVMTALWHLFLVRVAHIEGRDNALPCMRCNKFVDMLEWAHVKKRSINPDMVYDLDNWMLLCPACHKNHKDGDDLRPEIFKKWLKEQGGVK